MSFLGRHSPLVLAASLTLPYDPLLSCMQVFGATLQDFPDEERRAMARESRASVPKHGSPARQAITQKVHEAMLAAEVADTGPQVGTAGLHHPAWVVPMGWAASGMQWWPEACVTIWRCKQHLPADHVQLCRASSAF